MINLHVFFLKLGKCLDIGYISRACFHFRSYAVCSSLVNGFGISSVDSSSKKREPVVSFPSFRAFPSSRLRTAQISAEKRKEKRKELAM